MPSTSSSSLRSSADAFARDDHARHALRALGPRHGHPRQPVAVGRRRLQHRLRLVRDVQVDAVQIVARLLGRDGEAGLVDDLAERRGRQLEAGRQIALGDHREIVARQRRQGEAGAAGIDLHPPLGGDQLDLAAFGQLADDVEQGVGGTVVAPGSVTLASTVSLICRSRSVAISRSAALLLGLDQDVRQDRNRVPALHHRVDVAQALEERGPFDRRLHRLPLLARIFSGWTKGYSERRDGPASGYAKKKGRSIAAPALSWLRTDAQKRKPRPPTHLVAVEARPRSWSSDIRSRTIGVRADRRTATPPPTRMPSRLSCRSKSATVPAVPSS